MSFIYDIHVLLLQKNQLMTPKATIIMPVYNTEKFVKKAIESVLNQTFVDFEFIIINDCSSDKSLEIIMSFNDERIKLINNKNNKGVCKSFNEALLQSKSELIFRMDSDDICLPEKLEKQINFMDNHPEVVALGTNANIIDMDGNFICLSNLPCDDFEIKKNLSDKPVFVNPTTVVRKKELLEVGGYYEPIIQAFEDFILWNKLKNKGKFYILPEVLLQYRIVKNSLSNHNFSKKYKSTVQNISVNGFATEEELNTIKVEKAKSSKNFNAEASYNLILAERLILTNYNPKLSREKIILSLKSKLTLRGLIILFITFLTKNQIAFLLKNIK
jgi:glycosyltransferase involved in cell wall biosynthesis